MKQEGLTYCYTSYTSYCIYLGLFYFCILFLFRSKKCISLSSALPPVPYSGQVKPLSGSGEQTLRHCSDFNTYSRLALFSLPALVSSRLISPPRQNKACILETVSPISFSANYLSVERWRPGWKDWKMEGGREETRKRRCRSESAWGFWKGSERVRGLVKKKKKMKEVLERNEKWETRTGTARRSSSLLRLDIVFWRKGRAREEKHSANPHTPGLLLWGLISTFGAERCEAVNQP